MGLLNALTKAVSTYGDDVVKQAVNKYGDDVIKGAMKGAANKIDDVVASYSFWNTIGNMTDDGISGTAVRGKLKDMALGAIDAGDDASAKAIMSNMPVVGRSSGSIDDLLGGRVGSYYQMTPANNIMTYGDDALNYTTVIDPDSALKANDGMTRLVSPGDTGLPSANGKTLQDWQNILKREVGGGLGSTEMTTRDALQDYVYRNQGRNFQMGEPSYAELALPTDIAKQNLQLHVNTQIPNHMDDILNNTNRGNAIVNSALDKIKNSKNRSKAFDHIFLTGAPILGGGAVLASLLGNGGENNNQPI